MTPSSTGTSPTPIVTAPAVSADPNYNGLNAADVSVTNLDDDASWRNRFEHRSRLDERSGPRR